MHSKKKFQELNLCDNFLFSAVMQDTEICKEVLELLLDIKIEKVVVQIEREITYTPAQRGIRMDVYAADENHTVYNVEMQTSDKGNLPKRSRHYQGLIDTGFLKPGEDFNKLPKSFIIFICTFDPFKKGRYYYTMEERCLEEDFSLGDGTRKIFLNTKGKNTAETDAGVIQFLKYIEDSTQQCVDEMGNIFLGKLHERITKIKHDRDMEERYMVLEEMLADEKTAGNEQVLRLIAKMNVDGKGDEIISLSEDKEFFKEMLNKYQIK